MVSCLSSNILRLLLQVPTESPISLQTNLLRGLFPSLARLFPDMEVEFEASPESQPLLTFTPGNVTFMPVMDIRISALQSNSSAHRPLFHLRAKANISASISVRSGRIFGSVASGSNLKLELKHSSVSYFHVKLIEVIINHFVFKVVLPFLNGKSCPWLTCKEAYSPSLLQDPPCIYSFIHSFTGQGAASVLWHLGV
ncbi:lipopolysaccharide-binding protein-like [Ochotona curzoniae]|uniref:lipopolysaccharide-binding protein-like n=1 Tax=Ochotona curzoniae TaxID=130825 RepID=UPI001B35346F|nr:lipopolysaccharide-binding protein-like [Ochotona curzoniae]